MGSYSDAGGRRVPQRKPKEGENAQWIYAVNRYAEQRAYKKAHPKGFPCQHSECITPLTSSNWAAGSIFCFYHESLRGGLGFCKEGHDLYEVGATEIEHHCKRCIEEGTLQAKLVEVEKVSEPVKVEPVKLRPLKAVEITAPAEQFSLLQEEREDQLEELIGGYS